jgi:predicted cupin superfamily sugar epimerase
MAHDPAHELIARLGLEPLPHEGGFFRATWRSETASAILFLITPRDFSALHRIAQDEIWHFHAGDPVEHVQLDPGTGAWRMTRLGADVLAGEAPQVVVPAGVWQGARLAARPPDRAAHGFALIGCTVSPPWEQRGFALGARRALTREFPAAAPWIAALTRDDF